MRVWRFFRVILLLLAACAFLIGESAWACTVPVFRYALERWPADRYDAVVFHRGPLAEADRAIIDTLKAKADDERRPANLRVLTVDLASSPSRELQALWEEQRDAELPWTVVLYPFLSRVEKPLWAGRLTGEIAEALVDSPKRREIARRLLEGESVVWVLLESGSAAYDDEAATTLSTQLARLTELIELPFTEEDLEAGGAGAIAADLSPVAMLSTLPLRLAFSVVRVARDDPAERLFVDVLMKIEPDLYEFAEHPIVFPVFGRGRALFALVGPGINERTLEMAGAFLTGACSCQAKAMNPGTDLLMSVNWDGVLDSSLAVTELLGLASAAPAGSRSPAAPPPTTVRPPSSAQSPVQPAARPPSGSELVFHTLLIALAVVLLLVLAGTATIIWAYARRKA